MTISFLATRLPGLTEPEAAQLSRNLPHVRPWRGGPTRDTVRQLHLDSPASFAHGPTHKTGHRNLNPTACHLRVKSDFRSVRPLELCG